MILEDNPITLKTNLNPSGLNPYDYQQKAIDELDKHLLLKNHKACILQIPTGGGKTYTAVRWLFLSALPKGYKIVWIAHRIDLLLQARQTMIEESGLLKGLAKNPSCKIIGGDFAKRTVLEGATDEIIILSANSLSGEKGEEAIIAFCKKNKKHKIIFVIDEAHHSAARNLKVIIKRDIEKNDNFKLLGLTATPTRTVEAERAVLLNLFGNTIISEISLNKLIKDGQLAWPKPEKINTNLRLEDTETYSNGEDGFTIDEATRVYFETRHELDPKFLNAIGRHTTRNRLIVDTYIKKREQYGKTLVFAIDIPHATTLKTEFEKHKGIRVDLTHSGIAEHHEIIKRFKASEIDVLINISRLTEGFDDPKIQTVFLTRPTQSEILFMQMIGRGLRGGVKGTKEVHLVSFEDHWEQFTGWLDAETYIHNRFGIAEAEDEEKITDNKETSIVRTVSFEVINELYKELQKLNMPELVHAPPFECWPLGWYTLLINSEINANNLTETELPITRTIIVFSHQKQSWDALCKAITKENPSKIQREKLYEQWFDDLPNPTVSIAIVDLFIDTCYITGKFIQPEFYSIPNREAASPDILAQELYDKPFDGKQRKEYISKWYIDFPILQDIYGDLHSFSKAVSEAYDRIENKDEHRMTTSIGEQFLKAEKLNLNIPETDNIKLEKVFNKLKANITLFPNGYDYSPELEWTHRVMKSYFGIAYLTKNKIKINRLLNSKDLEQNEELIEFVMYHEMLHFSVSKHHNKEFRDHENKFPNSFSLNGILDGMGMKYHIDSKFK
jgi:ATP-dependent helicase IRC3